MHEPVVKPDRPTTAQKLRAYLVHIYTASGVVLAFLATIEICRAEPDPRWVFGWLALAVLIDATDGTLARRWQVKRYAPQLDGRTIDDLVDYLTFTFVPLLLVWRMEWLPPPAALWIAVALVASLLGFAHVSAKQELQGLFRGFPSYWNIVAFYIGLAAPYINPYLTAAGVVALALFTVAPVRFIYPNLAPSPWRRPVLIGAYLWLAMLLAMLPTYPQPPGWLVGLSLVCPVFYVGLSLYLDLQLPRGSA